VTRSDYESNWPDPKPEQTRVMLLGSAHLDSPRVGDVLSEQRQREFESLTERLADWELDAVAVERSHRHQNHVDDLYDDYRTGDREYDEQYAIESPRMLLDDPEATCQSEVIQLGFRLADRLDHDRVHAVDYMMDMGDHLDREVDDEWFQAQARGAHEDLPESLVPDLPNHVDAWTESTVSDCLAALNRERHLRANDRAHFAAAFGGPADRYVGSELLTGWYERNLKTAENLRIVAEESDADRMVLVVGLGHVHILRQLLDNVPMLCPVSPLPLLED
jgi:hypothetical protein